MTINKPGPSHKMAYDNMEGWIPNGGQIVPRYNIPNNPNEVQRLIQEAEVTVAPYTGEDNCRTCFRPNSNNKETNPKDAVGTAKSPASVIPRGVVQELGLAMLEGARKYGRHNYRNAGVRASVYFDAANRHLDAWWEGEDVDPDSGLSHIIKCIASLTVLRDSMMHENWTDDRPPKMKNRTWLVELNAKAKAVIDKYPHPKDAYLDKNNV